MSSPSRHLASSNILKARARSDTTGLLSPDFDPPESTNFPTPQPELTLQAYTNDRLQKELIYAVTYLNRHDIPSRFENFMHVYKVELKDAMQIKTRDQRLQSADFIRIMKKLIEKNAFLRSEKTSRNREMQNALLKLRELQYFNRYEDYVKIVPTRLRFHVAQNNIEN